MDPMTCPRFRVIPSATGTIHSRQSSPVWAVSRERSGVTRSTDTLFTSLLNDAPRTTPTVSFITSSRKAKRLYSRQSSLLRNPLSCEWNELSIMNPLCYLYILSNTRRYHA